MRRVMSKEEERMTEPTIICPNCKTEIKLTESLAAPLLESTRKQFEQQLAQKDSVSGKKTAADAARLFNVHPATVSRLLQRSKSTLSETRVTEESEA